MRPDLDEARTASDNIKGQLHYKDVDELDSGMQKVQQLDVLDKDIEKYRAEFVKAANTAPKKSAFRRSSRPSRCLRGSNHCHGEGEPHRGVQGQPDLGVYL
eukprot:Em0001g2638a